MSFTMKIIAMAGAGLLCASTAAFAQAGGPDVPSNAKAMGTMENGASSTGMSKSMAMKKSKMMHRHPKMKHPMKHRSMHNGQM